MSYMPLFKSGLKSGLLYEPKPNGILSQLLPKYNNANMKINIPQKGVVNILLGVLCRTTWQVFVQSTAVVLKTHSTKSNHKVVFPQCPKLKVQVLCILYIYPLKVNTSVLLTKQPNIKEKKKYISHTWQMTPSPLVKVFKKKKWRGTYFEKEDDVQLSKSTSSCLEFSTHA